MVKVALDFIPVLTDFSLFFHERLDDLQGSIGRSIINDDNMVVCVILHHYRPDIPQSPFSLLVVEGWNYYAEWQFLE